MDHLMDEKYDIKVIYVNKSLEFFSIDRGQLYCNTPSDFDFKLQGKNLSKPADILKSVDIIFPVIHGKYGEDGALQKFLEDNNIPFVGSSSASCSAMFSKSNVNKVLKINGFDTTELVKIDIYNPELNAAVKLIKNYSKVIVKPDSSGSSICVYSVTTVDEIKDALKMIAKVDDTAVVEELCQGSEFTVIVLQNDRAVALVPTQIEILSENKIFDYRKKYLPTNSTRWISPPTFSKAIIKYIMESAERIFEIFQMRDFVRIDGWVLNDGRVVFSDINPVCGMEQNSFLFQQGAWVGMTHKDVLKLILKSACNRYKIATPKTNSTSDKQKVPVIFGGDSAERQVSLMSGTNVWLKLLNSKKFQPVPYMLDGDSIWYLPYQYTMNHTVEEIKYNCAFAADIMKNLQNYVENIQSKLDIKYELKMPYKISIDEFLQEVKLFGFIFLALHGGIGEDGTIQQLLEKHQIRYNGSDSETSKLCMNKYETGRFLRQSHNIVLLPKILCKIESQQLVLVQSHHKKITYDCHDACNTYQYPMVQHRDCARGL
jgi:D-alanine--D-alanine ligase